MVWETEKPRARVVLTEDELEEIAERAAQRALALFYEDFYYEVGKVTIRSILYVGGAAFVALAAWLGFTGRLA